LDSGGAIALASSDEQIELSGTIGQPDAGLLQVESNGVLIAISGGFWPHVCHADVNGDGIIDPLDAGFVLSRFGCAVDTGDKACDAADVNGDGIVDPLDDGYVKARFGVCQ